MKKLTLLLFILFSSNYLAFSQQAIAKIKFEEAQEAFDSRYYELTLSKINEVEELVKGTGPKVIYLKIMAESKLIEQNPMKDYKILENTRNQCSQYLKDYETLPDNEEKYRDIYKVSESLKQYPQSEILFNQKLEEIAKQKQMELDKKTLAAAAEERQQAAIRVQQQEQEAKQRAINEANAKVFEKQITEENKLSFMSLGITTGDRANYGIAFETGGDNSPIGTRLLLRSSLVGDSKILDSTVKGFVTAFHVGFGLSLRVLRPFLIYGGVGYTINSFIKYNYADPSLNSVDTKEYLETNIGAILRLGRVINIHAGYSYLSKIPQPEITFGITFNLVKKL